MKKPTGKTYQYLGGDLYHPSYFQLIDEFLIQAPSQRFTDQFYDRVGQSFALTEEQRDNPPHLGLWFVKPSNAGQPDSWDVILPVLFRGKRFEARITSADGSNKHCAMKAEPGTSTAERKAFAWAFTASFAARYWEDYSTAMLDPK